MLKGRQISTAEFWKMGTTSMANIFLVTHAQEYTTYSRTIRQRPATPDPQGTGTFFQLNF